MKHLKTIAVVGFIAATVLPAAAVEISGAGATFPYPVYAKWADTYKKETGVGLNYQSIGSGGGIKQIEAKTVTFGATDAPLKGADLEKFGLVQFPMVMGGIVPVINVEGLAPGELVLDGPTLAEIFPRHSEDLGRSRDQEAQPERQVALAGDRGCPPVRRFRHDLQLHLLSGTGEPGVEIECRLGDVGRMADWHRCQGQRRRFQQREPDQGLDRLCRICLRAAKQADPYQDGEQATAKPSRRRARLSRPPPPMPTGIRCRASA